jgi:RNA polymerase sigma-70 factor (ECF subfamily)
MRESADAKDALQLTFCQLWEHRAEIDTERVKSWLFTVAHHKMIDHFRRRKHTTPILPLHLSSRAEEEQLELQDLLDQALQYLPAQQRMLITLRDYEGYSYREIAEIADLKLEQVKVYLFRARKKLRKVIEQGAEAHSKVKV